MNLGLFRNSDIGVDVWNSSMVMNDLERNGQFTKWTQLATQLTLVPRSVQVMLRAFSKPSALSNAEQASMLYAYGICC